MYNTDNSTQGSVMTWMCGIRIWNGGPIWRGYMYKYSWFPLLYSRIKQHCKTSILQFLERHCLTLKRSFENRLRWKSGFPGYSHFLVIISVQFSLSVVSNSLRPHEPQHTGPPCPPPTPGVHPNPCPSSQWCHLTISSSVVPFSSCPQSFPASRSFPMNQLFTSGGQILEFQLQHQFFQWTPRTDLL